jgi:hypothetical protein
VTEGSAVKLPLTAGPKFEGVDDDWRVYDAGGRIVAHGVPAADARALCRAANAAAGLASVVERLLNQGRGPEWPESAVKAWDALVAEAEAALAACQQESP